MADHDVLRELVRAAYDCKRAGARGLNLAEFWPLIEAAEQTLPKTKMVEVWHCQWVARSPGGDHMHINAYRSEGEARDHERFLNAGGNRSGHELHCVTVTGPHQQEVPT